MFSLYLYFHVIRIISFRSIKIILFESFGKFDLILAKYTTIRARRNSYNIFL